MLTVFLGGENKRKRKTQVQAKGKEGWPRRSSAEEAMRLADQKKGGNLEKNWQRRGSTGRR